MDYRHAFQAVGYANASELAEEMGVLHERRYVLVNTENLSIMDSIRSWFIWCTADWT